MPYLKIEDKNYISNELNNLSNKLEQVDDQKFAGFINYINFVIVRRRFVKQEARYFKFAMWVGTMICCVLEVYRTLIAKYEDKCIENNGDAE